MTGFHQSQVDHAYGLIAAGRAGEAVGVSAALVAAAPTDHSALAVHAAALKAAGRKAEALPFNRRAAELFPRSAVAWHNLAATLDELGRHDEAVDAVGRAFSLGLQGVETRLVLAHAHMHRGDYDGSEAVYRTILAAEPAHLLAAQELARLIWVRTGDPRRARAPLQALRAAGGSEAGAILLEARILEAAGCADERRALFAEALHRRPDEVAILCAAAHAENAEGGVGRAAELVERATALAPDYAPALVELADVRLAQGRGPEALAAAQRAVRAAPADLSTWAWLATAARAVGDPVAGELCDYAALVRGYRIEAPAGWPDLEAFLADLAVALDHQHGFAFEPPDQSVRQGSQTSVDLSRSEIPELKALFAAFDAPIRGYLAAVGSGRGPLRGRNTGRYVVESAWSVRLRPNGFHDNHYHSHGWISCAFYVATPSAARAAPDRQGWLKLGQPPAPNSARFTPEHFVEPEPGLLVLFPSYMWHGTIPFTTQEIRLSVAFDILPG